MPPPFTWETNPKQIKYKIRPFLKNQFSFSRLFHQSFPSLYKTGYAGTGNKGSSLFPFIKCTLYWKVPQNDKCLFALPSSWRGPAL